VDEWSEIVLKERGPFRGIFHIKGGEPFVVPYLGRIMARLTELKSLRLMLTTNGTFTKAEIFESLGICNNALDGHVTVVVSLDGASAPTHEKLRGAGQFALTMMFLQNLQRSGIQTFLNCVLHEDNLQDVDNYIALAKRLDIAQINFLPLVPKGYGTTLRCHQVPHLQVHTVLQGAFDNGDEETRRLLAGSLPDICERENGGSLCVAKECVAAYRGILYIKPNGATFTCPNLEEPRYSVANVHTASLRSVMDRLNALYRNLHATTTNDRYLCTGERKRYEAENDQTNLRSLSTLQNALEHQRASGIHISPGQVAFCVSRNW
jgi:MoaA/NifB/PqqE/SkfB family radical SAM enzyme